jgi:hypothetical protein
MQLSGLGGFPCQPRGEKDVGKTQIRPHRQGRGPVCMVEDRAIASCAISGSHRPVGHILNTMHTIPQVAQHRPLGCSAGSLPSLPSYSNSRGKSPSLSLDLRDVPAEKLGAHPVIVHHPPIPRRHLQESIGENVDAVHSPRAAVGSTV